MGDPWVKFYYSDWRSDPKLRMCSMAARGLWIELLCIMHEAEPVGHLLVSGKTPNTPQLAVLVGASKEELIESLNELESLEVFSRTKQGVIYSRRMIRDAKKAATARKNGKHGGASKHKKNKEKSPVGNLKDKGGVKGGLPPQKPEARSQSSYTALTSSTATARLRELYDALGVTDETKSAGLLSISDPLNWVENGCDIDLDILPTLRSIAAKRKGRPPNSWAYCSAAVFEARDRRTAAPPNSTAPNSTASGLTVVEGGPAPLNKTDKTLKLLAEVVDERARR